MMDADTYEAGIELLKSKDPDNIWIDHLIDSGYSFVNSRHLSVQLDRLKLSVNDSDDQKPKIDVSSNRRKVKSEVPKIKIKSSDSIVDDLEKKKVSLFSRRAMLSNKFHSCKTDGERCHISDQIFSIQSLIKATYIDIEQYMTKGILPKAMDQRFPIPSDMLEKFKLRQRLRQRISNKKAHIRQLMTEMDDPKTKSRISKAEEKLNFLTTYKNNVDRAIE